MKLRAYLFLVLSCGALVIGVSVHDAIRTHALGWLLLAGLAIVTGSFKLDFASVSASIYVSDTFFITTALLFGPGPAAVSIALDSLVISLRKRDSWGRMAFNVAAPALSLWTGAQACFFLAGVAPLAFGKTPVGALAIPLNAFAVVYFLFNSGLTAVAVALESRQGAFQVWKRHFMWLAVGYLAAASAAFCLILLIQQVSLAAAIMVLPLVAVFYLTLRSSFGRLSDARRHLGDLDRLYLSTIETLAMAIDAKDDVTHSHVRRVQALAVGLARALGIEGEDSIKALKAAALLHDTGKLAVPEHILNKPGKLTPSEFEKMKQHVDVGADILSLVEFPYPVVPIVRCHHENWDGSGYPRGVRGDAIPIGARILSVVDCYDALTSDRPYRRAMSEEAALDILRERSGTMYDPHVVDTFIAKHHSFDAGETDSHAHREVLRQIARSRADVTPSEAAPLLSAGAGSAAGSSAVASTPLAASPAVASPPGSPAAASDDVLAFVNLARIVSGEASVVDVLALSSTLVSGIVPDASGVWYMLDSGRVQLFAADAFGPAAHLLRGMRMMVGERLSGWVAASRQPLVNSDAALDLKELADQATPALRSSMSVPLLMGETLVGVLSLYSAGNGAFDEHRGRLLQMIAPHIAGALHAAGRNASAALEPLAGQVERAAGRSGRELRLVPARVVSSQ